MINVVDKLIHRTVFKSGIFPVFSHFRVSALQLALRKIKGRRLSWFVKDRMFFSPWNIKWLVFSSEFKSDFVSSSRPWFSKRIFPVKWKITVDFAVNRNVLNKSLYFSATPVSFFIKQIAYLWKLIDNHSFQENRDMFGLKEQKISH